MSDAEYQAHYEAEMRRQQEEHYAAQGLEYALHTFGPVGLIRRLGVLLTDTPAAPTDADAEPF